MAHPIAPDASTAYHSPMRRLLTRIAQVAGTAMLFSLLNLLSSEFQITDGVSILFPATAVSIISCMYYGFWGGLGVFIGTLATPWGSLEEAWQLSVSGLINAMEGMIPYLIFRFTPALSRDLRDMRSLMTFLAFGVVLNTGLSALLGNFLLVDQAEGSWLGVRGVLVWWIADFSAALLIATPLLAFGGSIARRLGAQTESTAPRTLGNALQITATTIILGWAASALLRNYLITRIESDRLMQQEALSRASLIANQIHSNFLFALGLELRADAAGPEVRSELQAARRVNAKMLAELAPLAASAGPAVKSRYNELDSMTSEWFDHRARSLETGMTSPGLASSHMLSRRVLMLKSEVDIQNLAEWQKFARNRKRIMAISMFTDAAVFGILALAALQLVFGMSRPLKALHRELGSVKDGGRFDRARVSSGYAELRSLADTLDTTFTQLGQREQELKKQTEMALEASRHKSDFLAKMSHELRTPLNSIVGFTDLLIEQEASIDPPKRRTFLDNVGRSARHLLNLINDLLDLARLESGKIHIDWQEFDVRRVLQNSVSTTAPLFRGRHQSVDLIVPNQAVNIRCDARRLEQILLNLLSNANKFSPEQSTVTVTLTAESRQCVIEVRDRGIGIPEDQLDHIFEEFAQLHARGEYSRGAGLGLSLVKRFVEALGGRITVTSRMNDGTTFRVALPRRDGRRGEYADAS
jgi:signal transduction histidine kinase